MMKKYRVQLAKTYDVWAEDYEGHEDDFFPINEEEE